MKSLRSGCTELRGCTIILCKGRVCGHGADEYYLVIMP